MENQIEAQTAEDSARPSPVEIGVRVESGLDLMSAGKPQTPVDAAPEIDIEPEEDRHGFTEGERRMYPDLIDYGKKWRARNERRERQAKEKRRRAWVGSDAGRLLKQLGHAYMEYKACLEKDPKAATQAMEFDEANQRIFDLIAERLRNNVEKAQNAPRCARIMAGGRRCRAPRVRGKKYCHMHQAMEEARPQKISLPGLDDANAIQVAIAKSAQALVDGEINHKQASLLACYLRLAANNVKRLDFEEQEDEQ